MGHGKLIVIEGVDATGKRTQADLLVASLVARGKKAVKLTFPDYDGPMGVPIKRYLSGEVELDEYQAAVLFAADRMLSAHGIVDLLKSGTHVVCDRYVASNAAHQSARIESSPGLRREFVDWVDDLEFERLHLPVPNFTIVLSMPAEAQWRLLEQRAISEGRPLDNLETGREYQLRARQAYLDLVEDYGWDLIECIGADGVLLPPEEIHARIADLIKEHV